jgi:NAD(P)-dependent dehydrogenase (short-subunit alcohol dehydrogenase family)
VKKTILILGKPSPLLEELTNIYLTRGCTVAVTAADSHSEACIPAEDENPNLLRLGLNRRSPLSNRACLINTLTAFESIDEAILVHTATGDSRPVHELPAADVEALVDNSIKGVFYSLKEIISYFWKQKRGIISMVTHSYGSDLLTPIDAAAEGSFRAITESLFTYYKNEPVIIHGFESQSPLIAEYAAFISKAVDEKSGKIRGRWFRFAERGKFLSNISIPGIKK